ncbi:hypothetical protein HYW58_01910 [Candidatus Kaiserbacteria bacterium]|nr:hypothetical protein [Candidatus Kaiserbacteria bacterium]
MINKKLARDILGRVRIDQMMRKRFIAGKVRWDKRVDKRNTTWLKRVMKQYGFPMISLVGKKASHGAWLLIQHADHDLRFQKKVLATLNEIYKKDKKEINPADIAYLTDRILVHEKKPQVFGTQFTRKSEKEEFKSFPIKNKRNVDKRRKKYGLSSLDENERRINRECRKLEDRKLHRIGKKA